ncbi:MAG: methylated-DNA--[protein]-cysteine S-methyltransferase [Peptococcaceae bacterium]|nr:methylated-DNA--[protein]-cysteine S-methyltransferase [Peptococcaceae bacterium]
MIYTSHYVSPLGKILLAADDEGLTHLSFSGQKYAPDLRTAIGKPALPVFADTRHWLDCYFSGEKPDFTPPLHLQGTNFQEAVWQELLAIPYGETTTYGAIAKTLCDKLDRPRMSAQAVGGAVGHNPIGIIVPCHRVIGTHGSLTGYAGGLDKKVALLQLEGIDTSRFTMPKKGSAL